MRTGDRSVLLLFKRGATPDTDAVGAIHSAFGIARSDLMRWEHWLAEQCSSIAASMSSIHENWFERSGVIPASKA